MKSQTQEMERSGSPGKKPTDPLVRTRNLRRIYEQDSPVPVRALDGVDFEMESGEFTAIAGPSGSGKTTLLNMIGALDLPTDGQVWVSGQEVSALNRNDRAEFRLRNLGFVFQAYNLIPVLTAMENAEFPLLLQNVPREDRRERVASILRDLGIGQELLDRRPRELSGGQQQRVAVARALVAEPRLILADEPTANLDTETGNQLLDVMQTMNEKTGVTFLFSTHDPRVMDHSRRLVRLEDGKIVSDEWRENNR